MTPQERKEAYECSIQGFLKHFQSKNYSNAMEAFTDSMKYFAKINIDSEGTTCNINELLHVTKNEIAKYIVKKQIENKDNDMTNLYAGENNKDLQMFFNNPVGYTASFLGNNKDIIKNTNDKNEIDQEYADYVQSYNSNIKLVSSYLNTKVAKIAFDGYEKKNKTVEVLSSIEAKLPSGKDPIDKEFAKQKPGFFERLRNKTSKEYLNFKETFKNYNDEKNELYGDDKALEDSAMAYIRHKFPNLKNGELPTAEQISKLSGAGKPRTDFCVKVVESVRENRLMKPFINNMVDACKNIDKQSPEKQKEDLEQKIFQNKVADDVKKLDEYDNEKVIEDNANELTNEKELEDSINQ